MKTRQDNDMTNRTNIVYIENEIKLLWLIGPGMVYEKNSQDNDVTDHRGMVLETKLSSRDQSGRVLAMTKTK